MGFHAKILLLALVVNLILFAYQQSTPEERCAAGADYVCSNCFNFVQCVDNGDGTFSLGTSPIPCPTTPNPTYCDDTLFTDPTAYGQCSPIPASTTDCGCSSSTTCIADPNNASVVLHCESSPATSDPPCSVPAVDLNACSCLTCSDSCPLVDDPNDDCSMYYLCYQGNLLPANCSAPYCFMQSECKCLEPFSTTISSTGISTTDPSTLGSSTAAKSSVTAASGTSPSLTAASGTSPSVTVASVTSPSVTGASGTSPSVTAASGTSPSVTGASGTSPSVTAASGTSPSVTGASGTSPSVTGASGTSPSVSRASGTSPSAASTLESSTTESSASDTATTPSGSGSTGTGITEFSSIISSISGGSPSTTSLPVTCPAGECPFIDDPNDDCKKYFYCYDGQMFAYVCPSGLCFEQDACQCNGGTTLGSTTALPTCSDDCPYADDPNDDCLKYFFCYNDEVIPYVCPSGLCFDQAACSCVESNITTSKSISTSIFTTKITSAETSPGLTTTVAIGSTLGPTTEPKTGPTTGPTTRPTTGPTTGPTAGPTTEPTTEPITRPIAESTTELPISTINIDTTSQRALTCPPGCPYVDDPDDNCQKFFICDNGALVPHTCTGNLCFYQDSCQCDLPKK